MHLCVHCAMCGAWDFDKLEGSITPSYRVSPKSTFLKFQVKKSMTIWVQNGHIDFFTRNFRKLPRIPCAYTPAPPHTHVTYPLLRVRNCTHLQEQKASYKALTIEWMALNGPDGSLWLPKSKLASCILAAHYTIKNSTLLLTTKAHITIINMEYKLSTSNMVKRVPHVLVPHQMGLTDY